MIFSIPEEISKLEQLEKLQNDENLSLLLTYPKSDKQELKRLQNVSKFYKNVSFYYTTSSYLKKTLKINEKYGLVIFRNFDSGTKMMTNNESFNIQMMKGFINKFKEPLVRELTEELLEYIFNLKKNVVVNFVSSLNDKFLENFKNSAKNNMDFIYVFSLLNEKGQKFSEFFSINSPCLRILKFGEDGLVKYKLENLEKGLDDFKNDKLSPYYRSQKETEDEGLLKIVTGNNYEELILKREKNVILLVYAPWMDNFDQIANTYNNIAENLKKNEDILFTKMDISKNEHPSLSLKNLPSLLLFKLGEDKALEFDVEFTSEYFMQFLDKNLNVHYMEQKEL